MASGSRKARRNRQPADRGERQLGEYRCKRDFTITPEPSDAAPAPGSRPRRGARGHLQFVIQKHDASSLHYDLRLELDGVMKSWAVPKGPSLDPADRRLAMQVEDHPIAYNTFEGTIPQGEYGGGTVMLWDRGTYFPDEAGADEDHETVLRREMGSGKLSITLEGERLGGSFALVRTDRGPKPKWLLIKHRDRTARPGYDVTADVLTSVDTGRTMDEIAHGDSAVWHSNRAPHSTPASAKRVRAPTRPAPDVAALAIEPMRPRARKRLPGRGQWRYELMPGGRRVLAYVTPETAALVDDTGTARTGAWPAIAESLQGLARRAQTAFVLDGEVTSTPDGAGYVVYDLLLRGEDALLGEPWRVRRDELEALFRRRRVPAVDVLETSADGAAMRDRVAREGYSGFRARAVDGTYTPGSVSDEWLEYSEGD